MCDGVEKGRNGPTGTKTVFIEESVGMALAHDITEIRRQEFKGPAFRKGHIIRVEDIDHLRMLGKEHVFVLSIGPGEMHEDEAASALADALMGDGVAIEGEPREGKFNLVATRDGLLMINREALFALNMLGEVMCATRHGNTMVRKGRIVAGTRAIPLVVKQSVIDAAVTIAQDARAAGAPVIRVKPVRKPRAGIVITGNEVYQGRVKDAFAPVLTKKIEALGGEISGIYYAPDDSAFIEQRLRELLGGGADLLLATGGMSVDPDDVTRFAIRNLGAADIVYGTPVLPGAMFLIGYLQKTENRGQNTDDKAKNDAIDTLSSGFCAPSSETIPILGIPACGMYHAVTVLDLILPRVLAGETIGRRELAELGHGGLCLNCRKCRYPVCPFGK